MTNRIATSASPSYLVFPTAFRNRQAFQAIRLMRALYFALNRSRDALFRFHCQVVKDRVKRDLESASPLPFS